MVYTTNLNHDVDKSLNELVTFNFYCPFCKWRDMEVSPRKQDHVYTCLNSLGRYIRDQHFAEQDFNEGFDCLYKGCSAFLGGGIHFLNHTARQHKLTLWRATKI